MDVSGACEQMSIYVSVTAGLSIHVSLSKSGTACETEILLNRSYLNSALHPPPPPRPHSAGQVKTDKLRMVADCHSSGAVWESRWTSWAVRPNEPSGFRGRKDSVTAPCFGIGHNLSLICLMTSEDITEAAIHHGGWRLLGMGGGGGGGVLGGGGSITFLILYTKL